MEISLKDKQYCVDIYVIEAASVNNPLTRHAACQMCLLQRVEEATSTQCVSLHWSNEL